VREYPYSLIMDVCETSRPLYYSDGLDGRGGNWVDGKLTSRDCCRPERPIPTPCRGEGRGFESRLPLSVTDVCVTSQAASRRAARRPCDGTVPLPSGRLKAALRVGIRTHLGDVHARRTGSTRRSAVPPRCTRPSHLKFEDDLVWFRGDGDVARRVHLPHLPTIEVSGDGVARDEPKAVDVIRGCHVRFDAVVLFAPDPDRRNSSSA